MDAFEPIRSAASALHDRVVAHGVDPFSPLALTKDAADILDLELVCVSRGDVALKGARALYDEQAGTILFERTDDPAQEALLVAHEVGHTQIHPGSASCTDRDIDASQTIESAPVGLQKVEDYGARERRELQANVFAREFLLPRGFAKRLHLDEQLGAKEIAARTGLPVALVSQQLLDALLLPHIPAAAPLPPALQPRPDPDQDRAAAHRGSPFLLQAGPGTGKTRTLVKRVVSLLREGVDPASILVLTFSNRAAGELSERVAAVEPDLAPRIWMGTFHAFGLDLVRRYHDRFGLPADPSLFDRSDAIEALEEVLPTLSLVHYQNLWDPTLVLRDIVSAISRAKDEMVSPARYLELAEAMATRATDDQDRKTAAKCREVAQVYDVYEKMLADLGGVDFGDLIMRPTVLLETDAAVRTALQIRHRHVLVDEYQDVNHASVRLLKALAGDGGRLWVVGDARQSIYRFRGASSRNVAEFATDFPGATADRLKVNYRSTDQVTGLLNAIAPRMSASNGMLALELAADRGPGSGKPEVRRYTKPDVESAGVAAAIRELQAAGVEFRDQAVLCRTNSRLSDIARTLEALGIPALHLGSLFERDEVRDLLAILSLVVDPYGDALVRVGAMERYAVPLQDVHAACRHLRQAGLCSPAGLVTASALPGLSAEGAAGLARIAADLGDIENSITPWDALTTYLLDRTDLGRRLAAGTNIPERMRAIAVWQLLNFIRDPGPFRSGLPIRRALDRVRQLVLLNEERDLRHVPAAALQMNAVRLMTVHGSKGLEFEAVHVPGLTVASFPLADRGERCPPPDGMVPEVPAGHDDPEEECLFFVACSRARTHLRLHLSRLQSNGNNRKPSPFLDWLPAGLVGHLTPPATFPMPPAPEWPRVRLTVRGDAGHTDSRLALFERCPRRFLYTHVLGLGGGKKPTAFLRTHQCLLDLLVWLGSARVQSEPSAQETERAFDEIWKSKGPAEHAFADKYRSLAFSLINSLVRASAGRRFQQAAPIAVDLAHGRVIVEPDELATLPDGTPVLRRVSTGRARDKEFDHLEYTLYLLAGQARFGSSALVEAVHLTDGTVQPVKVTPAKIANRRAKADGMLGSISDGDFSPNADAFTCPRCPHFFVCDALPQGPLVID